MLPRSRKPADIPPPRIGRLAKLPVFLDLDGRPAVVAGGTAPAAWKAELLAAAGAEVRVFAATPGPELMALFDRVTLIRRDWQPDDLVGSVLAVIDADDREAERFRMAARAAGAICSAIDRPDHCDVQFGAIVNRSPVVIGISTDGAAPVLAQGIRQRIETLLPPALADWAAAARSIRRRVADMLPDMSARRLFWQRFTERAFRDSMVPPLDDLLPGRSCAGGGQVTLVGAGPGDAELLTLKALRALQAADVILFDDLVSPDVLELARREARRMMVGKRGRRESCRQEDINARMVRLARQGKRVVRLKAGDPMVFGRAGEEIAALDAAGIPVSVVPGITTAVAAAASLGISLTHRDVAQSVRFVTAHSRRGGLPEDLDWHGLADPHTSLMIYMGGHTGADLAARLMANGLPAETPAVVMASVSRPDERRWTGSLASLGDALGRIGCSQPVLIGIGQVFAKAQASQAGVGQAEQAA